MNINRKTILFDTVLLIAAIGLYAPSLWYEFIGDDLIYFIGNKIIQSLDVLTILRFGAIGADYLPLRDISFAIDYLLWGEHPLGYHLTNVFLYGITVVSVKHLFVGLNAYLTGLDGDRYEATAFFAAMLFAIHPFHREVVSVVFNRGTLLTALFCILGCILYVKHIRDSGGGYGAYALALSCYVFALLSREYGIILPMLFTLIVFFRDRNKIAARMAGLLPFYFIGAVFYVIYMHFAASFISMNESLAGGIIHKIASAFRIAAFYGMRMVTFSGRYSATGAIPFVTAIILLMVGLLVVFIRMRRLHPQLIFGYLFYLVALLPVLNFYGTLPVVAVRYAYLPCVGLFIMLTAISFKGGKRLIYLIMLVYTFGWTFATGHQVKQYENNIAYWEFIASHEQNAMVYEQLGLAYYRKQQYQKTFETLSKVEPKSSSAKYYVVLGDTCINLGDYQCAVQALNIGIMLGANDLSTRGLLARAYQAMADGRSAERIGEDADKDRNSPPSLARK